MTPTEINRAIAELCGARDIRISNRWEVTDPPEPPCVDVGLFSNGVRAIPDYYHSLDACAEFEKDVQDDYYHRLAEVTYCDHLPSVENPEPHFWRAFASATAPQRCEAFLRMHGKWRDA